MTHAEQCLVYLQNRPGMTTTNQMIARATGLSGAQVSRAMAVLADEVPEDELEKLAEGTWRYRIIDPRSYRIAAGTVEYRANGTLDDLPVGHVLGGGVIIGVEQSTLGCRYLVADDAGNLYSVYPITKWETIGRSGD